MAPRAQVDRPSLSADQFVQKWRDAARRERAQAQEHFIDLCRLVEFPTPTEKDPAGEFYTFERGVQTPDGHRGFADVWYRGKFAWEYKGEHGNLDKAYQQLQFYREDLWNPPVLVVTDMDRFRVHGNFTGKPKRVREFGLADLDLKTLRQVFHDPMSMAPDETVQTVTEEVAEDFASLAESLEGRGVEPRVAAHFLVQVLFCLFAEDVGLLRKGLFTNLVEGALASPEKFPTRVEGLFATMRDGGDFGPYEVPWFNGGLFAWIEVQTLTKEELRLLLAVARKDWSSIDPSIFGTLFERSLDPEKRQVWGQVYTPRRDIERIINPVVLAPLKERWQAVKNQAGVLKSEWDQAIDVARRRRQIDPLESAGAKRARAALEARLFAFQDELASVSILDPACGSGNFLYVALVALQDLEKEVSRYAASIGLSYMLPKVGPGQVLGIEIDPYARELAQAAVWIGHLQWMRDNGFQPERNPVLKPLETIQLRDALLDRSDPSGPREVEWPATDYVIGNPPFVGGNKIRKRLASEYVDDLFTVYDGRVPRFADLCCYFFEKTRELIADGRAKRAGLLATNSIRGGANRAVLKRIKESGDIFEAWSDEEWIVDGTAVRTSMVGFDNGAQDLKRLNDVEVTTITSDLCSTVDVTTAVALSENRGICFMGASAKAPFDIPESVARGMLDAPLNPNGRPNADVVRPVVSAIDIARGSRGVWTIDFGLMGFEEASLYELPFEYVKERVYPLRMHGRRADFRGSWWQYARPRPELRRALIGKKRQLVTPAVAKHRLFVWRPLEDLCNQGTLVFARDDDYLFGALHSRAHQVWSLRMGTSLGVGNDPRYTPTTCFETFPLPWPLGMEPGEEDDKVRRIADAARELDGRRQRSLDASGGTLTALYNKFPTWLANAHVALNQAVWAAYGWESSDPEGESEHVILSRLLALNTERAAGVVSIERLTVETTTSKSV